jgi:hypothetical protein
MYRYHQSSGQLERPDLPPLPCYSGHGAGLNNPAMQDQHDVGPLPQGRYTMTALIDSPHTGLSTIDLNPDPENHMFGRSGFRIHGDNGAHNHTASEGCIIAGSSSDRIQIWNSGDRQLTVVP